MSGEHWVHIRGLSSFPSAPPLPTSPPQSSPFSLTSAGAPRAKRCREAFPGPFLSYLHHLSTGAPNDQRLTAVARMDRSPLLPRLPCSEGPSFLPSPPLCLAGFLSCSPGALQVSRVICSKTGISPRPARGAPRRLPAKWVAKPCSRSPWKETPRLPPSRQPTDLEEGGSGFSPPALSQPPCATQSKQGLDRLKERG